MTELASRKRPLWNIAIVLLAVIAVGGVALSLLYRTSSPPSSSDPGASNPVLGTPRPAFTLRDLDGVPRAVSAWDGKVLVLNFWATWCQPCLREIPMFDQLQREHGPSGLQFIGVAIDDADAVRQFQATHAIDYPMLSGNQDAIAVAQSYGNDVGILPYTAVVDRSGTIRFIQYGEIDEARARAVLDPLLETGARGQLR